MRPRRLALSCDVLPMRSQNWPYLQDGRASRPRAHRAFGSGTLKAGINTQTVATFSSWPLQAGRRGSSQGCPWQVVTSPANTKTKKKKEGRANHSSGGAPDTTNIWKPSQMTRWGPEPGYLSGAPVSAPLAERGNSPCARHGRRISSIMTNAHTCYLDD